MFTNPRLIQMGDEPRGPVKEPPFAWLCDACHRHSYEEFPTREAAMADARRHRDKVHPGEKVEMATAQKDKADVPIAAGFRTLCGACMGPIDSTAYDDANLADEAGEIHRQKQHPGPRNIVIIVAQRRTVEQYRESVIADLRRAQWEADHGGLKEPFGHRAVTKL